MASGAEETVRLLVVEDDEDDYLITRDLLADGGSLRCTIDWSAAYEDALAAIRRQRHDVYLVDYRLGGRTGLELIREAFASRPSAPVIMLTGAPNAEIDLEATALGATEFLTKQELTAAELERAIRHAISHHKAERYALAARASDEGIWDWDLQADRLYLSPRWHAILGAPEEATEEPPTAWFHLVAPEDLPRLRAEIEGHLDARTPALECEFRMRHRDGDWRWVIARGVATRDAGGTPVRMAGSLSDTTDGHADRRRLEHEALHDALTGLPNRALFLDRVAQTLQRAGREASAGCALLFLDLDEFKAINDELGHVAGDRLLIAVAERVADALRPGDTVARLGGDEFTVLLEDLVRPQEATVVARRILRALAEPVTLEGHEVSIGASIGIALGAAGVDPEELIAAADMAMYDAKHRGKGRWAMFDERMHRRVAARRARGEELRRAIDDGTLDVRFQPILGLHDGGVIGVEALARWPAHRPAVAPAEFVAIAEETGVIAALGEHVLATALAALRGWIDTGAAGSRLWLSVNVSPRQLSGSQPLVPILAALRAAGVEGDRLRLEVAEGTIAALERAHALVAGLREAGIGLHIDAFGTGYSSLTALHRLPIRALKIDRRLVADIAAEPSGAVARSVVAVAHSLGAAAIGAGIEHERQRERLRALGCDAVQGLLVGPPLEADEVAALLASGR